MQNKKAFFYTTFLIFTSSFHSTKHWNFYLINIYYIMHINNKFMDVRKDFDTNYWKGLTVEGRSHFLDPEM